MAKLTPEQEAMFEACLATGAAWTTSKKGPNAPFLSELQDRGIMEEVAAPVEGLVSYRITPAGRTALATFNEALDEWGCTDPAKRAEAIAGFIAGGCQLWEYEVRDVAEVVGHA